MLVSAAGLSTEHLRREPLLAARAGFAGADRRTGLRGIAGGQAAAARRIGLSAGRRYPERLSVPLTTELMRGANTPGFIPRWRR